MTVLFKNHHGVIGSWQIEVTDNAELKIGSTKKLGGKTTVRIVLVEGKNIGKANETSPLEQAHKEMAARIQKQLDKGYVTKLEDADEAPVNSVGMPQPVLATVLEKVNPESIDWDNAYLQPKLNGHRCMYRDGVLYSRGGKAIDLPHIVDSIHAELLDKYPLDGELYIHGTSLQQIGSMVKKPREESLALEYHVYDCPMAFDSFFKRYISALSTATTSGAVKMLATVKVTSMQQVHALTDKWVAEGYEGSILRHGTSAYEFGKRSRKILKIKNYTESEAEIVGFEVKKPVIKADGTRFEVICFVLKNHFGGVTFEVTAPGNEQEVHDQALNAENYIGKMMTLKYFELSDDSVPQQPVALQVRDDL